jgi:hypothetical protein
MNQKLQKLKEKVNRIDEKINAGGSVEIHQSKDGARAEPVLVESQAERAPTEQVDSPQESAEPENFNLDYANIDLSDADINEIIRSAPKSDAAATAAIPVVNVTFDAHSGNWILLADCVYRTDDGWTITAKEGFVFDLASVPRFLWALISSFDLSLVAPLYHDLLYRNGGVLPEGQLEPAENPQHVFSRLETDNILYELMEKAGVTWWKRQAAYRAVRTFAGFAWKG